MTESQKRRINKREAFVVDAEKVRSAVGPSKSINSLRELSRLCGYKPNTLPTAISPSKYLKDEHYNYNILNEALDFLNIQPETNYNE